MDGPAVGEAVVVGAKERLLGAETGTGALEEVDRMSSCRVVMMKSR